MSVCVFSCITIAQCSFSVNAFTFIKVNDHRCLRFTPDALSHITSKNNHPSFLDSIALRITEQTAFVELNNILPTKITDGMYTLYYTIFVHTVYRAKVAACSLLFFLLSPTCSSYRTCRFTVFHKRNCYAKGHNEMQTQLDSNKTTMTTKAAAPCSSRLLPPLAISPPLSTKPTANNNNYNDGEDEDDEGSHSDSKTTFQWQQRINERFS